MKSVSKSRRAKIAKKVDSARLVAEQVMGNEFDLDSDEELQIDEKLGKEKAKLLIRSSMFLFDFFPVLPFHTCFRFELDGFWIYQALYTYKIRGFFFSVNSSPL